MIPEDPYPQLPTRHSVFPVLNPVTVGAEGLRYEECYSMLEQHFVYYGIPQLSDCVWGWDDDLCAFGSREHMSFVSAVGALVVREPWTKVLSQVFCTDGALRVGDLVEYQRRQSAALYGE